MEFVYKTSPKLFQYVDDIDKHIATNLFPRLVVVSEFDGSLDTANRQKIELLITGCRVYVRVMQGIDVDVPNNQTNLDFFYQIVGTEQGYNGKRFADMIGGNLNLQFSEKTSFVKSLVNSFVPSTKLIEGILNVVFDFEGTKQQHALDLLNSTQELLWILKRFLSDFYPSSNNTTIQTPAKFTAKPNPDGTVTVENITIGDLIIIDSETGIEATATTFTSKALTDGLHKISVIGINQFSYADTLEVTTKISVLSNPLAYVNNNKVLVGSIVFFLIFMYVLWKKGYFKR